MVLVSLRDPGGAGAHHPGAPDRRPGRGRILLRPIGLAALGHLRGADSQSDSQSAASRLLGTPPARVPAPHRHSLYSSVSSGGSKLSNNSGFLANFFSTLTISPVRNPARNNPR